MDILFRYIIIFFFKSWFVLCSLYLTDSFFVSNCMLVVLGFFSLVFGLCSAASVLFLSVLFNCSTYTTVKRSYLLVTISNTILHQSRKVNAKLSNMKPYIVNSLDRVKVNQLLPFLLENMKKGKRSRCVIYY